MAELSLKRYRLKKTAIPTPHAAVAYRRMRAGEKTEVLARVASSSVPKRQALGELGVPGAHTTGG